MKILWYANSDYFLKNQNKYLEQAGYKTRLLITIPKRPVRLRLLLLILHEYLRSPDLVFCDFVSEQTIILQKVLMQLPRRPKVIVRIHRYELYQRHVSELDPNIITHVITVSEWAMKKFLSLNPRFGQEHVSVVNNGIDHELFNYVENRPTNNEFVTVGRITHVKGFYDLVESWPSSIPLTIVGPPQHAEYCRFIQELVERRGLTDVKLVGKVANKKLPELFKRMTFYVNSSLIESCPVSLLEAMSCGLIPLVRNWPAAAELIPKRFLFNDFAEMKRRIAELTSLNVDEIRKLSRDFREQVASKYTIPIQMKQLVETMNRVLGV